MLLFIFETLRIGLQTMLLTRVFMRLLLNLQKHQTNRQGLVVNESMFSPKIANKQTNPNWQNVTKHQRKSTVQELSSEHMKSVKVVMQNTVETVTLRP